MEDSRYWVQVAVSTILTAGVTLGTGQVFAEDAAMEKCYGIVKKGMNECAANNHPCQAQSSKDNDPAEWIYLPKGTCNKITGGSTKPLSGKS